MKFSIFQNSVISLLNYVMVLKIKMKVFPSHVFSKSSLLENAVFICFYVLYTTKPPGRVAQSVGRPTRKSGVPGSIPGLATYFRFSFRFFKKGSCQLLAKVCARSTG